MFEAAGNGRGVRYQILLLVESMIGVKVPVIPSPLTNDWRDELVCKIIRIIVTELAHKREYDIHSMNQLKESRAC